MKASRRSSTFTLPGAHVVLDDVGHHLRLELLAERALEVDVLDHRHRRLRRAERHAVLRDALEERVRRRLRRAARSRASRRVGTFVATSPAAAREDDARGRCRRPRATTTPPAIASTRGDRLPAPRGRPSTGPAAARRCARALLALLAARHRSARVAASSSPPAAASAKNPMRRTNAVSASVGIVM